MNRARSQLVFTLAIGALAAARAMAQSGLVPQAQVDSTQRIVPGSTDLDPLRGSIRVLPTDLRAPTSFENVYKLSTTDRFGKAQDLYARRNGGLTAVFPRSVYVQSRKGLVPEIPAGTVFIIGDDHNFDSAPATISRAYNAVSFTAPLISAQEKPGPPAPVRSVPLKPLSALDSIWKDETYRQRTISRLLESSTR
jgi:hypothetical protein